MLATIEKWKICIWDRVSAVAGYEPPATSTDNFNAIFDTIRSSTAAVEQMEQVREGLVACHYHLWNVTSLEQAIVQEIEIGMRQVSPPKIGEGIGGGNTRRFDFEYQAMLLACRRVLEYLARAIEAFFNFKLEKGIYGKRLAKKLRGLQSNIHSEQIASLIESFCEENADLVGEHSKRNRLAHKEALRLGTLNVGLTNSGGLRVVLGGELFSNKYLDRWDNVPAGKIEIINPISVVMQKRLSTTEEHVFSVYSIITEAIQNVNGA